MCKTPFVLSTFASIEMLYKKICISGYKEVIFRCILSGHY